MPPFKGLLARPSPTCVELLGTLPWLLSYSDKRTRWVRRADLLHRRAKYYRLTSSGRAQLKVEERDWNQVVKIMAAAVESA